MRVRALSRRRFVTTAAGLTPALVASGCSRSRRPNLLVLVSDQQHWQAMGEVDSYYDTPHLDALASEGVLMENAFCTTPQCSPSRSSLMTGFYPSTTGVMGNIGAAGGDPLRQRTLGWQLQQGGYTTGYFGKWHLGNDPEANSGWAEESKKTDDAATTDRGVKFLREHAGDEKPFALFLHWLDPHDIYHFKRDKQPGEMTSAPLPKSWREETFQEKPPVQRQFMTEDQGTVIWEEDQPLWEWYRDFYRGKVRLYDNYVGEILSALKENGLWENTIIAATSDHGDMDTNHHLIYKGPFMYEHMVRIPGIFRVPKGLGGVNGRRIDGFDTVNVDITPTLLDLAGLEVPSCDGRSLRPLLTGGELPNREYVIGQYYSKQKWVNPIRMIRTHEFKYNKYILHGEELYDLTNDPEELVNLADDAGYAARKKEMEAELSRWIEKHDDPFYSLHPTDRQGKRLSGA